MQNRRRIVLGVLAVAAVVIAFAVVPWLRNTVRSPRAIAAVVATVVAARLVRAGVGGKFGATAGRIASAVPVVVAVWVLLLPSFRQTTLEEDLPTAAPAMAPSASSETATTTTTSATAAAPAAPTSPTTAPSAPAPSVRSAPAPSVPASAPPTSAARAAATAPPTSAARAATTAPTSAPPTTPAPAPAPTPSTETQRITTGTLEGINHDVSGTVSVYRLGDGSHIVRFEDVNIKGAPDPVLYLVRNGQRSRSGGTNLGDLKAMRGSFNHAVPASYDVSGDFTVFVWCERFSTPIAAADQQHV